MVRESDGSPRCWTSWGTRFKSWRVKTFGKAKVRLCQTGAAAQGLIVIAACLEVDGSSQVYHTANMAMIWGE
jgi:hypothetical protein